MISFRQTGDFSKTMSFLERAKEIIHLGIFNKYGRKGVSILKAQTPVDTGLTASSWFYEIKQDNSSTRLIFGNRNIQDNVPIAIIIQFGHATGSGAWVEGIDYINPALAPVFKQLADELWKEVTG